MNSNYSSRLGRVIGATLGFLSLVMVSHAERYRPQYHFTAETGYINDPNGLFYLDGTYHLFFQHGQMGRKQWGHATSTDLFHWRQYEDALLVDGKYQAFSGSAVIDLENTSGLGTAAQPPVVLIFTSWGQGQCLASSTDRGQTWHRYAGNPVLTRPGDERASFSLSARDPHVFWDAPRARWVLVMYDNISQIPRKKNNAGDHRQGFSIFTSPDLKVWTHRSHLPNFYVCPDMFSLPVAGSDPQTHRWLAMDWERYCTGHFDGEKFTPDHAPATLDHGTHLSANQSWKNLPDGRTIQISWIRDGNKNGKYPDMKFEQQLSCPVELSLRDVAGRLHLCKQPVRELAVLRRATVSIPTSQLEEGKILTFTPPAPTESYELELHPILAEGDALQLTILGVPIVLERSQIQSLGKRAALPAPLRRLRILADITSIEYFVNDGEVAFTHGIKPPDQPAAPTLSVLRGRPALATGALHVLEKNKH